MYFSLMISMWFKKIIVCSTVTGACFVTYLMKNGTLTFYQQREISNSEDFSSYIYLPNSRGIDFVESIESTWSFWKKKSLPIYWKLLMLCKSKDLKARHKAVESLSKLTDLEKWQFNMIAQSSDVNTAVGLARSFSSSSNFFLPPPFKDLDEGNLHYELYLMLSSLKLSTTDICLHNQLKQILKSGKFLFRTEFAVDLDDGDPSVIYHSQQKKKLVFLYDKLCLEVFLACSADSHYRKQMRKKQILKLFLKVLQSHKNDVEIISLIAQILANLALDEKFKNNMYKTGWIGILSEWKKSPHISINLPACKALANLDNDDLPHPLYDNGVYILNPVCRLSESGFSADVIFIHGLLGATFWTWRQCDSQNKSKAQPTFQNEETFSQKYTMCWPRDWLAADIPSLRLISIDYKTSISNWGSFCSHGNQKDIINTRAKELINKLLLSHVGEKPIIWVAHSMGGLIVKQMLAEAFDSKDEKIQSMLKKTAGVIFYSVPHMGSELATKINSASVLLQLSSDIAELQKGSASLLSLHEKFKVIVAKYDIPIISFGETKKSRWGLTLSLLVPLESANPGFGEIYPLPVDHLSTCKPVSTKSADYLKVVDFLKVNLSRINSQEMHSTNKKNNTSEISKIISLIP